MIKETSTCAYLMVLHTPRLCNDVAFQPPQKDAANSISCTPILRPEEAETYVHEQKAYKSAVQEAQIWEANPDAAAAFGMAGEAGDDELPVQIVGDIIVGGHAIVPEGVTIEKSGILGGKDKYIDTIATSGGKTLSKEELKKLGLDGSRALENLEKLKKNVEAMAKGEKWKIVVVDTPQGREYRGMVGEDEDDAGKDQKKGKAKGESETPAQGKQGGTPPDGEGADGGQQEGSEEEYFKEEL
jgi:protein OS-9